MPIPAPPFIGQVLQRKKNRDHVRDCLVAGIFSDAQIETEYAEIKAEMDTMMKRSLRHTTFLGKKYRIAFAPLYGYPSETAHFIRGRKKTDIEVIIGKDGKFSLRSVPPISHLIAREFGGGGHPNAAGDGRLSLPSSSVLPGGCLKRAGDFPHLSEDRRIGLSQIPPLTKILVREAGTEGFSGRFLQENATSVLDDPHYFVPVIPTGRGRSSNS